MDKTKELIETWKEIEKYLTDNDDAIYFGIDQYSVNEKDSRKRWLRFTDFQDLRLKMDVLIKSLEAENGHSN